MKRTRIYYFSAITTALIFAISISVSGQSKLLEKTWEWNYDVSENVTLELKNYNCDLTIHTWDKGEVTYKMSVDATMKSEEDVTILNGHLEKLDFTHSAGRVSIDNLFWENRRSKGNKTTMELKGG
jgi:hypothetical protein